MVAEKLLMHQQGTHECSPLPKFQTPAICAEDERSEIHQKFSLRKVPKQSILPSTHKLIPTKEEAS